MSEKFKKLVEDFVCENCELKVSGNGYTDHCPRCLFSKHVDVNPGDRNAECKGLMEPVDIAPNKDGYKIFYKCSQCGFEHTNKAAPEDAISDFLETLDRFKKDY